MKKTLYTSFIIGGLALLIVCGVVSAYDSRGDGMVVIEGNYIASPPILGSGGAEVDPANLVIDKTGTSTFEYGATFATVGGNVGIGTADPAAKLQVDDSNTAAFFSDGLTSISSLSDIETDGAGAALTLGLKNTGSLYHLTYINEDFGKVASEVSNGTASLTFEMYNTENVQQGTNGLLDQGGLYFTDWIGSGSNWLSLYSYTGDILAIGGASNGLTADVFNVAASNTPLMLFDTANNVVNIADGNNTSTINISNYVTSTYAMVLPSNAATTTFDVLYGAVQIQDNCTFDDSNFVASSTASNNTVSIIDVEITQPTDDNAWNTIFTTKPSLLGADRSSSTPASYYVTSTASKNQFLRMKLDTRGEQDGLVFYQRCAKTILK